MTYIHKYDIYDKYDIYVIYSQVITQCLLLIVAHSVKHWQVDSRWLSFGVLGRPLQEVRLPASHCLRTTQTGWDVDVRSGGQQNLRVSFEDMTCVSFQIWISSYFYVK